MIVDDLKQLQILDGMRYCPYNITQNQWGWSPNQPPEEWLNITFPIYSDSIQITSLDSKNYTFGNRYISARVIGFMIHYYDGVITTWINYWAGPWTIYISFPEYKKCPNITIKYGTHV